MCTNQLGDWQSLYLQCQGGMDTAMDQADFFCQQLLAKATVAEAALKLTRQEALNKFGHFEHTLGTP